MYFLYPELNETFCLRGCFCTADLLIFLRNLNRAPSASLTSAANFCGEWINTGQMAVLWSLVTSAWKSKIRKVSPNRPQNGSPTKPPCNCQRVAQSWISVAVVMPAGQKHSSRSGETAEPSFVPLDRWSLPWFCWADKHFRSGSKT